MLAIVTATTGVITTETTITDSCMLFRESLAAARLFSSRQRREVNQNQETYMSGNVGGNLRFWPSVSSVVLIRKVFAACDDFCRRNLSLAFAFPAYLCAPCGLCGEGFWLRLRRAVFPGLWF